MTPQASSMDLRGAKRRLEAEATAREKEYDRQRRADAIAAFVPYGSQLLHVLVCPRCSALVTNPENHVDWHASLDLTAAKASKAAFGQARF